MLLNLFPVPCTLSHDSSPTLLPFPYTYFPIYQLNLVDEDDTSLSQKIDKNYLILVPHQIEDKSYMLIEDTLKVNLFYDLDTLQLV